MINLTDFLSEQLADSEVGWSMGTFGAIAEFTRDPGEATEIERGAAIVSVVTMRGGLRIGACHELRPIAAETLTRQSWSQRLALCLPRQACAMSRRTVLTEIGPDGQALRAEDRAAVLFDLGLGALQVDACVRTADPRVIDALRAWKGRPLFDPGCGAMSVILAANPHRVFVSRLGRIEVYQPIPPPNGKSPDGPHTHLLPRLLRHNRTHAATEPLPAGWIPCAHFYPPHPMRNAHGEPHSFDEERHAAFQKLWSRYGAADLVDIKARVLSCVATGEPPSSACIPYDRFARAAVRVALRQLRAVDPTAPALAAWLSAHDRFDPDVLDDSAGEHPCTA